MTTTPPASPLPTGDEDPAAVSDLTALATELHRRGYATHLTSTPPCLAVTHPYAHSPCQTETIHAGPEDYTWETGGEHAPLDACRADTPIHIANRVDELFWALHTCDTTGDLIDALTGKYLDYLDISGPLSTTHNLADWLWLHLGGLPVTTVTCDGKAIQWT